MRAILLMFDSLNRHWLPAYGGTAVPLPNFERLAARSVTFDRCFVGSMPCMPARRDLHTGRYNFLHRAWGPLEPFDDSMPELLKKAGVHTHLVTDHQHYWEDGGATYHNRYSTYEFVRGQEGDRWKGRVDKPPLPPHVGRAEAQDEINRAEITRRGRHPQEQTVDLGLDFIRANAHTQNWFVQIETFDPHEPFHAPERLRRQVGADLTAPRFDWPPYRRVQETPAEVERCRREYAALLTLCDESLGRVLDLMDHHQLWDDTLLIVGTDHGFLLGEHELWAKCHTPFYNEIAHTPLFCWDPRLRRAGRRCDALVQLIDVPATLLDLFAQPLPPAMQGRPLSDAVAAGSDFRPAALFGMFGGHLNITDGRHVLMQAPIHPEEPIHEYTLMPTRMRRLFEPDELAAATLSPPLPFTKGMPLLRVPASGTMPAGRTPLPTMVTSLYDTTRDSAQLEPLDDPVVTAELLAHALCIARAHDAPAAILRRYGLPS
jgi:arylsulfatase A-like enzyme